MKKLLTVSLVAVMAVSAAHADLASTAYVDGKIGALDVTEERVAGSYVAFVNEADGKVASQKVAFDQDISETSTHENAPTSKAVYDAISGIAGDIADLDLDAASVDGSYVSTVAQADGQVSQQLVAFDGKIEKDAQGKYTSKNAPSSAAVADFVLDSVSVIDGNISDLSATVEQNAGNITGLTERLGDAEDTIDEHTDAIAANRTDIGDMTQDAAGKVTEFAGTAYIKDSETLSTAAVALDTAIAGVDAAKQDKSAVAYQIGTSDGGWVSLVASLPDNCKTGSSVCSLVATGGKLSWEVIAGQEANDETITTSVISETADAE